MKYLKTKIFLLAVIAFSFIENVKAQQSENILDSLDVAYLQTFEDGIDTLSLEDKLGIGYRDVYYGNNERGNRIMDYVLSNYKDPHHELLHMVAVQNVKNGNYARAYDLLSRAADKSDQVCGYFGWVLLYYFRDYERALVNFDKFDTLTPKFSDTPVGEDINYLRGLAYLKLNQPEKALHYIDHHMEEMRNDAGEDWIEVSTFYYKGIAHYQLGEYTEAKEAFELAIKYNEKYTEAYYYLYLTLNLMNESEDNYYPVIQKAKELADRDIFRRDAYVTYFFPVYAEMIDKEIK